MPYLNTLYPLFSLKSVLFNKISLQTFARKVISVDTAMKASENFERKCFQLSIFSKFELNQVRSQIGSEMHSVLSFCILISKFSNKMFVINKLLVLQF